MSITVIQGIMPLLKAAADAIAAFTGNDEAARADSVFTNAAEVFGALTPLIDAFTRGANVTEEDVRNALVGMDQALAGFDAEIARQDTTGTDG
jgi:hypothetical protein